ncbi:MAG: DUF4215 domain-containing protein [Candidatus Komeilibacteria bacterium]|nr:DUF4215 domain-containing protein [Candidatus Komeilibacteria bacterium]
MINKHYVALVIGLLLMAIVLLPSGARAAASENASCIAQMNSSTVTPIKERPGLTPKSPLYFLDKAGEWVRNRIFSISAESKLNSLITQAEEKIDEILALQRQNSLKMTYATKLASSLEIKLAEMKEIIDNETVNGNDGGSFWLNYIDLQGRVQIKLAELFLTRSGQAQTIIADVVSTSATNYCDEIDTWVKHQNQKSSDDSKAPENSESEDDSAGADVEDTNENDEAESLNEDNESEDLEELDSNEPAEDNVEGEENENDTNIDSGNSQQWSKIIASIKNSARQLSTLSCTGAEGIYTAGINSFCAALTANDLVASCQIINNIKLQLVNTCREDSQSNCGNSAEEVGEQCDDGNTIAGDGCSNVCQNEYRFYCGDGVISQPNSYGVYEECENQPPNQISGDGCSSLCINEADDKCGDGVVQVGEECDDGNDGAGDGCNNLCQVEEGDGRNINIRRTIP